MSEARRVSVQSDIPYDLVVTQLSYIGDGWDEDEVVADEDGGESNNNEANEKKECGDVVTGAAVPGQGTGPDTVQQGSEDKTTSTLEEARHTNTILNIV